MVRIGNRDLHNMVGIALLVGVLCGITAVLVDIDHLISFTLNWPVTTSRFLHTPALIIGGIILIACIACIGGLLLKTLLRRKRYV